MRLLIGDHYRNFKRKLKNYFRRSVSVASDARSSVSSYVSKVSDAVPSFSFNYDERKRRLRNWYIIRKTRAWNWWVSHERLRSVVLYSGSLTAYVLAYGLVINYTAGWFGAEAFDVSVPFDAESVLAFGLLWYILMEDVTEKVEGVLHGSGDV